MRLVKVGVGGTGEEINISMVLTEKHGFMVRT